MTLLRASLASALFLVVVAPFVHGCGFLKKDKGADASAEADAAADAAVAVETPDAAAASASVATIATTAPIIGACKPGDLADCQNKCEKLKNQSSCVNLGLMFQDGTGVPRDTGKATTLFQGACNAGVGAGCERFGSALLNGSGIVADAPRAADTFKKGCDLRNASSCNRLALMNVRKEGGQTDTVKAVALFEKSCNLGDAFGCGNLANHLASGDGVPRDPTRAASLRKTACDKGDAQACRALGTTPDAGAATVAGTVSGKPGDNPSVAECAVRKKTFLDTCKNTCADKIVDKNPKFKTRDERLLFCEGGCSTQMFNTPIMAPCKGK